jgi:MFS transporter, FSR family, fosmidomycin resistance protein
VQNSSHNTSKTVHRTSKMVQPLLWGILHGLNDFAAGFMLAHFTFHNHSSTAVIYLIIYSIIGFGGQLPVGIWLDSKKQIKPFAQAALFLLPLSIIVYLINAEVGIIFSGLASAFVHVTGGAVCLLTESRGQVHDDKVAPLGLFTAPGVFGLTLGGIFGQYNSTPLIVIGVMVLVVAFLILQSNLPSYQIQKNKQSQLDAHDYIMLGLLLMMCFRSFIFDIINYVAEQYSDGLLIIGISAFLGKIIGGFIADKIGWKKFVYITLPLAFILFQFGKQNIYALGFGIACLQSSVPITLLLMSRSLPIYPATATALSLGASVALAGLPLYLINDKQHIFKQFNNGWLTAAVFTLLIITAYVAVRLLGKMKRV